MSLDQRKELKNFKSNFKVKEFKYDKNWTVTSLILDSVNISDLKPILQFDKLETLHITFAELSTILGISELKRLKDLNLSNNYLTNLSELEQLSELNYLKLNNNRIESIGSLQYLKKLQGLELSNNKVFSIQGLQFLSEIKFLDLSFNKVSDIWPLTDINKFISLNLYSNEISEIPEELFSHNRKIVIHNSKRSSGYFNIGKNELISPPDEIVKQGQEAIKEYILSLQEDRKSLNEGKVILVGDGGAGKTSLVDQIFKKSFNPDESQTQGIKISRWSFSKNSEPVFINFWDFGGQEIMHATHQFFLSKRCLYILVLDSRKDEKAEYWLKHIESFGGASPVIIVLNKIDENPSFSINESFLRSKYPGIKQVHKVSCKSQEGVESFVNSLKLELEKIEMINTMWPTSWFNVKSKLENLKNNYIALGQYRKICVEEGIFKTKRQQILLEFLHDLGVTLNFNEIELLGTQVLNPHWVTTAVYRLINSKHTSNRNGQLPFDVLAKIVAFNENELQAYPPETHTFIANIMKKFELCYFLNSQTILLPDVLKVEQPDLPKFQDSLLNFILEYDYLPKSIIVRFIVKMHGDIMGEMQWRTGVVLYDEQTLSTATVIADNEERRISISVHGENRRNYFSILLYKFREIHESFNNLKVKELVPMPDKSDIKVTYNHLNRLLNSGVKDYFPDGATESYNVKSLLGEYSKEEISKDEIIDILTKISEEINDKETFKDKMNQIIMLQPNFAGIGINFNAIYDHFIKK